MSDLLDQLAKRIEELKASEAQAIHNLGFVQGRLEEVEAIAQFIAESEDETRPTPTEVE